jgi:hypothetical protein
VTDEEVASYKENGWVKLDQLISSDFAAELLARAKGLLGPDGDSHTQRPGKDLSHNAWQDYHDLADEDDVYAAYGFSQQMGRNAQRLMQRDIPIRVYANMLAAKLGKKQKTSAPGSDGTFFHQDGPTLAFDRVGFLTFWLALDEVTPEMGSMQFYSGSQRLGSLGNPGWLEGREVLEVYPNVATDCPPPPPLSYRPGDATVHHEYTVHGGPANVTDRPRWSFIINYFPDDTKFTGALTPGDEHIHDAERYGLKVGERFDHPAFRLVYP